MVFADVDQSNRAHSAQPVSMSMDQAQLRGLELEIGMALVQGM